MFEGSGSYIGIGYEIEKGVPGPITSFLPFQSETINPRFTNRTNPNIGGRRARQKGKILRVDLAGNIKGAPDSESQIRLRASHQGKVVATEPVAGVSQFVMSPLLPTDPAEAVYRETLSGVVYRDDGVPELATGGRVSKVTFVIREGEFVDMTHELQFENFTTNDQPDDAVTNNAAFTGELYARGLRRDPESVLPVYIRVTTAGALDGTLPVPKIKAKIGGLAPAAGGYAAEFTGPEIAITHRKWTDLLDAIQTPIGPGFNLPFQVYFLTDDPTDVLTVADTWTIAARIPVVTPSFSTREIYDYGQLVATIDDKEYVWKSATVEGTKAKADDRGIGSYFTQGLLDNGDWNWTITFERNYQDRNFVNFIRAGGTPDVRLLLQGARIAATAYRDSHELYFAATEFNEAGTNVANSGVHSERVVLNAFDDKVNPIAVETVRNTVPIATV